MDQLSAYDIRVSYDSTKLTFVSRSFLADAPFGFGALEVFDGSTVGLAIDQVDSFLTSPADLTAAQLGLDGFDLFSLTFTAANMDAVTNLSFALVPNFTYVLGNDKRQCLGCQLHRCLRRHRRRSLRTSHEPGARARDVQPDGPRPAGGRRLWPPCEASRQGGASPRPDVPESSPKGRQSPALFSSASFCPARRYAAEAIRWRPNPRSPSPERSRSP